MIVYGLQNKTIPEPSPPTPPFKKILGLRAIFQVKEPQAREVLLGHVDGK